jgi:hypothetical protein
VNGPSTAAAPALTLQSPPAERTGVFSSSWDLLVFWWILLLVMQQAERLFLLSDALRIEIPGTGVLVKTLVTGLRGDFVIATIGVLAAAVLAVPVGWLLAAGWRWSGRAPGKPASYRLGFAASSGFLGLVLLALLTVDMGYYRYNQHHLDFVFFEYLDDLFRQVNEISVRASQAAQQTNAELQKGEAWGLRVLGFLLVQGMAVTGWWLCFRGVVQPALARWRVCRPRLTDAAVSLGLMAGLVGFHHQGPYAIRIVQISSGVYYSLAQNPFLYAANAVLAVMDSRTAEPQPQWLSDIPLGEAVQVAQEALGGEAAFPDPRYPFIRKAAPSQGVRLAHPANVVVIFVEGLDRRFLNRMMRGIRVTPFLDRLKGESLYFENFFANGTQTARGLFASFCSYYPRQGTAEMKTRYARDYLCLPSLLSNRGYRTEMVVGEDRDLNRLHLFMARNGLHQLYDESDFPPVGHEMGAGPSFGWPDGALLDMVRGRLEAPRAAGTPLFLATLTLSMHHPFSVPETHPEVRALQAEPDGYVAALRYLDSELERFFSEARAKGLLKDTVVLILGDHGRHEAVGRTEIEKQVGHFMSPLFIWMDDSFRAGGWRYPRTISAVASQVDLAPTVLALNGLTPPMAPFLGRDLSCVLVTDCLEDNVAYVSSVYDDLIGLADRQGVWLYSLRRETLHWIDLGLDGPAVVRPVTDPDAAPRHRLLRALYVSTNAVLEQNRIWSWKQWGERS